MRISLRFLAARKFWQRCAFGVACLATLIAAFYAIENARGHAAWARYREAAKARGVKLEWQEFIPPPIPDGENFAALPIFGQMNSRDPAVREAARKASRLPDASSGFGNGRDGKPADLAAEARLSNRLRKSWENAGAGQSMDLAAWQECFARSGFLAASTDDPAADVLRAMERYEPFLTPLREGLPRPRSRIAGGWEKGREADFWQFGDFLGLSKLVALHLAALLTEDRAAEAFSDWRIQYRLAAIFQAEPTLLAGMLRTLLVRLSLDSAWRGLAAEQWSDDELVEMEAMLGKVDLLADYTFAIASERALQNFTLDQLKRDRGFLRDMFRSPTAKRWSWEMLIANGWIDQNQVRINQWYDTELAKCDDPLSAAALAQTPPHPVGLHPYWFIFDSAVFMLGGNRKVCLNVQTEVDLCRVACALKRFQLRTGTYPQTLGELVPTLLPAIPADRADGQPLRYRRTDDGLLLHSVGEDQRDDGGDDAKDGTWRVPPAKRGN